MNVLFYIALAFFVIMLALWELGFDSIVARIGRGVLKALSFGRFQGDDTDDPSNIVIGALTIIAFFLLTLFLSAML